MRTSVTSVLLLATRIVVALPGVFGQKRGFLFPYDSVAADLSSFDFTKAGCSEVVSYIDWESWTFGTADPSFEFIAMARTQGDVAALATYLPSDRADKIAFLNEPDQGSTYLDVATAVQIWRQTIVPYRTNNNLALLSPAVTSDTSTGLPWLASFMAAVSDVPPDYIAVHYYGTDVTAFESYVQNVYNLYGLPIYITEVASTASDITSVTDFMTGILDWCDQQNWIAGVYWFAASRTANIQQNLPLAALMNPDGTRTPLGDTYCSS